jgi:hypothetical protein
MSNKIILKKSSVASKVPTTSDLDYGELAINYTDGLLYYKTAANTIGVLNAAGVEYTAGSGLTLTGSQFSVDNTVVRTTGSYSNPSWITSLDYSKLSGTVPTWNQNTTGSAASLTTARTILIGDTSRTFDGTANISWSLSDIGAYPATNPNGYTTNTGTVTSINLTAGTGMAVSGGPITTSGSITVTNNDRGSSQNIFKNIANSAGTTQFSAGSNNDTIRVASSGAASVSFDEATKTITIGATDTNTTYSAGTDLSLSGTTFNHATSGVTAGTYNNVTVNTRGHVTSGSNVAYLTGNQNITLSGDVTGSGATSIATTLANSGVTAGSYTAASFTVDSKGRITAASSNTIPTVNNATLTLATSGIATGSQTWTSNQGTNATFTVNVPGTNIAEGTRTTTTVPITSSTGTAATLSAATTSLAGVMTSADKTKLDGIATGATANTGTVTSIATNNGITGGTITTTGTIGLTGQALALHNLATNGIIVRTGSDTVAGRTITAGTGISVSNGDGVSGNPTITNSSPGATLSNDTTTNSNAYYPTLATSTSGSYTSAVVSSTKLYFNPSTGQLNSTDFNSLSDERAKKDVYTIKNALEKTLALRGVNYTLIENDKRSIGVIAQEIEKIIPEVVSTNEQGTKSVSYGNIVGLLIEAIKEQQKQIEQLKNIINRL